MISSIDLFFRRDCAGGGGPAVDVPSVALIPPDVLVAAAGAVGCGRVDAVFNEAAPPIKLDVGANVGAGAEDVDCPLVPIVTAGSFVELVVFGADLLRLEKMPPPLGAVPGASLLAPGVLNAFEAVLGACGESVEIKELDVGRVSKSILTRESR